MAWTRQVYGGHDGQPATYAEYLLDSEADLAELPTNIAEGTGANPDNNIMCSVGSTAMVMTEDGMVVYMLNNESEWKKV